MTTRGHLSQALALGGATLLAAGYGTGLVAAWGRGLPEFAGILVLGGVMLLLFAELARTDP